MRYKRNLLVITAIIGSVVTFLANVSSLAINSNSLFSIEKDKSHEATFVLAHDDYVLIDSNNSYFLDIKNMKRIFKNKKIKIGTDRTHKDKAAFVIYIDSKLSIEKLATIINGHTARIYQNIYVENQRTKEICFSIKIHESSFGLTKEMSKIKLKKKLDHIFNEKFKGEIC